MDFDYKVLPAGHSPASINQRRESTNSGSKNQHDTRVSTNGHLMQSPRLAQFEEERPASSGSETTWFIVKQWRVKKTTYITLCTGFLILSLFFERYCFITTVYKTKYYGYCLILIVIGLNCMFNMLIFRLRQKK